VNNLKNHNYPSVSIITPSYQQASFIRETIESVLAQDCPGLEYIVFDGGSTDGTIGILKEYSGRITWMSETDRGQADAVNKGFMIAAGEILGWLNSDDVYTHNALPRVLDVFAEHPEIVMIYGNAFYTDCAGKPTRPYLVEKFDLSRLAETCFICQPAVFFRREVFDTIGPLDINLQTVMDYDYWIRIGKQYGQDRIFYLKGEALATSRMHDANKSTTMKETSCNESMAVVERHFGMIPVSWTCRYLNEIAVSGRMVRFSGYPLALRAFIRIAYITFSYGLLWGMRSLVLSTREFMNLISLRLSRILGRRWYS
jgi:glycosyltransferase involved in cell wall biosynthesis